MDWAQLATELNKAAKLYKMFEEGVDAASTIANAEHYLGNLKKETEILQPQLAQLKAELAGIPQALEQARSDAAARGATQLQDIAEVSRKRSEEAQAALATWEVQLAAQAKEYDVQALAHKEVLARLQASADQLKDQIASLEQIKASLKSQLQGVA